MRFAAAILSVMLALPAPAAGTDETTVSFVSVDGGANVANDVVDVGAISKRVLRRIGIRIDAPGRGDAMLRAWLESPDTTCRIRIDGIELGAMPRVIATAAPIGTTVAHRIEIVIPADAPEGAISSAIAWEVIRN